MGQVVNGKALGQFLPTTIVCLSWKACLVRTIWSVKRLHNGMCRFALAEFISGGDVVHAHFYVCLHLELATDVDTTVSVRLSASTIHSALEVSSKGSEFLLKFFFSFSIIILQKYSICVYTDFAYTFPFCLSILIEMWKHFRWIKAKFALRFCNKLHRLHTPKSLRRIL